MHPALLLLSAACALPSGPAATGTTAAPDPGEQPGERVVRRLVAMGTGLTVEVHAADRATALAASEAAVRAIEATEDRLSTWRGDSELARLNAAPVGERFELSPALRAELTAARRHWEATDGAFDPGVGALVRAWDLRGAGRVPPAEEREAALAASGLRHLELGDGGAVRRTGGLVLEEGGFGKGAGLDRALAALAEAGAREARVDLGGQIAVLGDGPFEVRVAHPRRRDAEVVELAIDGGSVATSGNSERGLEVDGERVGHLLDPRTGAPAPDFGAVTVWAPTALAADALATGLFVLGPDRALDLAARTPDVEVLVLEVTPEDGLRARASAGLADRLRPLTDGVAVRVP